MNKKAQGLSITTVVVAILAILVLVVLFYIFTTKTGGLSRQLITCPGDCATDASHCAKYGGVALPKETTGNYITQQGNTCKVCCTVRFPPDATERVT